MRKDFAVQRIMKMTAVALVDRIHPSVDIRKIS